MHLTYVQALGEGFPDVCVSSSGNGSVYEDLILEPGSAALPDKAVLDDFISQSVRLQMWWAIQDQRDIRKSAGVKVGQNWFHSDNFSRIQQMALMMMGASMPAGIQWKTMTGTFVPMTPLLAAQIFQATAASDQAVFAAAEAKRVEMLQYADPDEYALGTGWPTAFADEYETVNGVVRPKQ